MKIRWLVAIVSLILLGITAATLSAQPQQRTLFVFGDSWARHMTQEGYPPGADHTLFEEALIDHGFDTLIRIESYAIGGSTMANWAQNDGKVLSTLTAALVADPNPDPILFFTLGGNDLVDANSSATITENLTTILDTIVSVRPDAQIIVGGYEILNPEINPPICYPFAESVFGSADPLVVNSQFVALYAANAVTAGAYANAYTANTFGTLQGTPGNPDLSSWSPLRYLADCVHLNASGYRLYLDTLFAKRLTPLICERSQEAAACGSRTDHQLFIPFVISPQQAP